MIFIYDSKKYVGKTAVRIVRAVERDAAGYADKGGSIRDFLVWSLEGMADLIPERELDVSPDLADETIAFNYLCLLDNYEVGTFYDTRPERQPSAAGKRGEAALNGGTADSFSRNTHRTNQKAAIEKFENSARIGKFDTRKIKTFKE